MGLFLGAASLAVGILMVSFGKAMFRNPQTLGILGAMMATEFYAVAATTLMGFGALFLVDGMFEKGAMVLGLVAAGLAVLGPIALVRLLRIGRKVAPVTPLQHA